MPTEKATRPNTTPRPGGPPGVPDPAERPGRGRRLATAAVVLAAVNLRPAVTSLGPVLAEARAGLGMSATVAGLLTSVPAACFALVGVLAPRLARRYGSAGVIAAGTALVTVGLAVRPFAGSTAPFLLLSAVALAGIAVVNVLLPAVVKQLFPERVGAMTGLYSMALNLGAATAAGLTVPAAHALGGDWRLGLAVWAALAVVAVPPWVALLQARTVTAPGAPTTGAGAAPAPGPAAVPPKADARITAHPVAWALAAYFGLQATAAYVIMGWLPQIFRDAGLPAETAGLLFAVTSLLGVPLSFALPAVAGRLRDQSGLAVVLGSFGLAGYAGLYLAPAAAPWLWAVLLGVANCSFPLALTMIGLRGRDTATVVRLSAFAQSAGYLLSIPGPVLVGVLYQHTGNWRLPLLLVALLMVGQIVAGRFAGRDRQIG